MLYSAAPCLCLIASGFNLGGVIMMLAVWDLTDSPIATAIKVIFNNSRDKRCLVWKYKYMRCLKRMREHWVWADNKDNVLDKNNHRLCEDGLSHRDVTAETAVSKPEVWP